MTINPNKKTQLRKKHNAPAKTKMEYGVVAILDALGTKGIWRDQDLETVKNRWETLLKIMNKLILENSKSKKFLFKINAFSDTIILTFTGNEIEKLLDYASHSIGVFIGVAMIEGIYLRGAISVGNFVHSDNLILGPAIDEAAEFFEKDNWIGASATPSTYSILKRLSDEDESNRVFSFIKYDIPRSTGIEKNGFALKHLWDFEITNNENPKWAGKKVIDLVHHHLEKSSNPTGADKWKNLLDFMYYLKTNPE